jgi:hypothetical protein
MRKDDTSHVMGKDNTSHVMGKDNTSHVMGRLHLTVFLTVCIQTRVIIYLYKRIGFFSVLNLCVRLSVRPSDILLARTQGNGYHSVSGVSLSVMGITQCPVCL